MLKYQANICNIHGCANPEYKDHMCQEHYVFYTENPAVRHTVEEITLLEEGCAPIKLRIKKHLHSFIHHAFDIPMPLYEHFPLEHIFLSELYSLRKAQLDVNRCQKVISDFDIPENENIAAMRRVVNISDVDTSELGPKEKYLLGQRDLPSMIPPILAVLGFFLLFCFFEWIVTPGFQIRGADLKEVRSLYLLYIPYAYALAVVLIVGLLIPSQYNHFVERCYTMTLYEKVEDNADLINQVRYVKDRKERAGSYYASILGNVLGTVIIVFILLLGGDTKITWQAILFSIGVALALAPLNVSLAEMSLYYPVIESMIRKRVAVDLYNADHRGGLKRYHRLLYLTMIYNEGLLTVLSFIVIISPISNVWIALVFLLFWFRCRHAGWAIIEWVRTLVVFNKMKFAEREMLSRLAGSAESMGKIEWLKRTHATGIIPFVIFILSGLVIPYIVNHLPRVSEILRWIGKI